MYGSDSLEMLKPFVGRFLQTPDEEKIKYLTENWSFIQDYVSGFDRLLMQAQKGQDFSSISNINTWRRLLLDTRIHGLESAISEHTKRMEYLQGVLENFIEADSLEEKREIIINEPDLLTSTGVYIMQRMVAQGLRESLGTGNILTVRQKMSQHMILLIKCVEFGIDFPFIEIKSSRDDYWASNP